MLYYTSLAAVFTRVRNERFMLPLWLRYYSRFFAERDIYVLDNDTTDGSTDGSGFQRIPIHSECAWEDSWMTATICRFQKELLQRYRLVLYTDVDEFVVPDPHYYRDLLHYIQMFDRDFVQTKSYTVCHDFANEPAIDLDRPILSQRARWGDMGTEWGKTGLSRVPLNWGVGQHSCSQNAHRDIDPHLYLIHLAMMDLLLCIQRRADRSVGLKIGRLAGKHVLDTTTNGVQNHIQSLLHQNKHIPDFIRAIEI